jgi:hypothetical protein
MVAFNFFVQHLARNSIPRQLINRIDSSSAITHLVLGNSLMEAGFNATVFDRVKTPTPARALNAALGATSQVEHLILLRRAMRHDPEIKEVIYGFLDFQLTEQPAIRNQDLIGNLAASYYLEPEIALDYYQMTPRDRLEFRLMRYFPQFVDRGIIWEKVERWRRILGEIGLPHAATNQFGRARDFSLLEASSSAAFARRCEESSRLGVRLNAPVAEMIQEARTRAAQVVIVEMPMSPYHRETFYRLAAWSRYRQRLQQLVEAAGVEYVSASDWIQDPAEFADNLHLSPAGAADFSRRLALYLAQRPALPEKAK